MNTLLAELERDFNSERTKEEGCVHELPKASNLGSPRDDKDKEKIFHLYQLGVSVPKIIETHLGYGKYLSLKAFINKCGK